MTISLCFFAHNNQSYILKTLEQLYKVPSDLKKGLHIKILNDQNIVQGVVNKVLSDCESQGIKCENFMVPIENNYMSKANIMAESTTDYVIKFDEDLYMTTSGWENFLKDVKLVNWDEAGLYSPIITTGIPSVELFLDHFVDDSTKEYIRNIFKGIKISDLWGAVYNHLSYDPSNYQDFFELAKKIDHVYKGIHPVRVSSEAQKLMTDYVLSYDNWKDVKKENNLVTMDAPYFCDSVFLVPTFEYKKVIDGINQNKYFCDGFDEVALNQHVNLYNKKFLFNLNSVCIHPSYNTIGHNNPIIKSTFYENI